jgi:hypothetical protein
MKCEFKNGNGVESPERASGWSASVSLARMEASNVRMRHPRSAPVSSSGSLIRPPASHRRPSGRHRKASNSHGRSTRSNCLPTARQCSSTGLLKCPVVSHFWTTPRYRLPSACAGFPKMGHFNDLEPPDRLTLARIFPKMSSDRRQLWPECPIVGHDETLAPSGRRKSPSDCPIVWTLCPTLGQFWVERLVMVAIPWRITSALTPALSPKEWGCEAQG